VFRIAARSTCTLHVHIRRFIAGLEEVLSLAAENEAPASGRPHQQRGHCRDARDAERD
jgi:hypothetical protein